MRRPSTIVLPLGLSIAAVWAAALAMARTGWPPLIVYNTAFAIAFGFYALAAVVVLRVPLRDAPKSWPGPSVLLIVALAILPRAILLLSTPALSDDLYRYIWDGQVLAAGINPYRYAPDAPELASLRGPHWTPINQKAQHTPYPPAAELVFAVTYQIAPESVKAQQVVATLADLLTIALLLVLLGRMRLPRERVLLYAWHPAPVLQFAHSAHHDAIMVAALLLALILALGDESRADRIGSGIALAWAGLVKVVPFLLAPLLIRRWRVAGTLACLIGAGIGLVPYLLAGPAALTGLGTEAGNAVFNDSLHYLLVHLLARITAAPTTVAGLITATILASTALVLARRVRTERELPRAVMALLGLAILLNAVVEPWYLIWMLPFVALFLRPGRAHWPIASTPALGWFWLSGAVQLTDLTYLGGDVAQWWPLIRAIEYGPLLILLLWTAIRLLGGRGGDQSRQRGVERSAEIRA